MRPELKLSYEIRHEGQVVQSAVDDEGESIQFLSSQRVVFLRPFPLKEFEAGDYEISARVSDLIQKGDVLVTDRFQVKSQPRP